MHNQSMVALILALTPGISVAQELRERVAWTANEKETDVGSVVFAAFNPDGASFAWAGSRGVITVCDAATRKELASLHHDKMRWRSFTYSRDGKRLVAAGLLQENHDQEPLGVVAIWETDSYKAPRLIRRAAAGFHVAALSPDGKILAAAGSDYHQLPPPISVYTEKDGVIVLYEFESGKQINVLRASGPAIVRALAFLPDGNALISFPATYWDWRRGLKEKSLPAPRLAQLETGSTPPWTLSPDGSFLVAGGGFNATKGQSVLVKVEGEKSFSSMDGHRDHITCVAVSPDGKLVASGGWDKVIKLWETNTLKLLASYEVHEKLLTALAFSPDGKTLLSADEDTLRLWDVVGPVAPGD